MLLKRRNSADWTCFAQCVQGTELKKILESILTKDDNLKGEGKSIKISLEKPEWSETILPFRA